MSEAPFFSWLSTAPAAASDWGFHFKEAGAFAAGHITAGDYASLPLLLENFCHAVIGLAAGGSPTTESYAVYLDPDTGRISIKQTQTVAEEFSIYFDSGEAAHTAFARVLGFEPSTSGSPYVGNAGNSYTVTAPHHPQYAWAPGRHFAADDDAHDGASIVTQAWDGSITTDYLPVTLQRRKVGFAHLARARTFARGVEWYRDKEAAAQSFWEWGRTGAQAYLHDNRQLHLGTVTVVGAAYVDFTGYTAAGDPDLYGHTIVFLSGQGQGIRRTIQDATDSRITVTSIWDSFSRPAVGDTFAVVLPDVAYKFDQETAREFTPEHMGTQAEFYSWKLGLLQV